MDEMITISLKSPKPVIDQLDELVNQDDTDRSKLIRKLIRQEYERRNNPELEQYRQQFARSPKRIAEMISPNNRAAQISDAQAIIWEKINTERAAIKEQNIKNIGSAMTSLQSIDPEWEAWFDSDAVPEFTIYDTDAVNHVIKIIKGRISWLNLHLNQPKVNYHPAETEKGC